MPLILYIQRSFNKYWILYILEILYVNPPKSNKNSVPSSLLLYESEDAALFTGNELKFSLILLSEVVCIVSVAWL